ncbi:MAG: hypothetical protein J1F42_11360 [Lachnospiraceae bacterium]|nr:hypothetical protein [Lachnospiraceae bacterium]
MKFAKRDLLILLGFLGILAGVGSYFLVYQPYMERAEALEAENSQLQARINDLSTKMENKDSYEAETARMKEEIEQIFTKFPVDVREEDGVLLAINQELIAPMEISNVAITACQPVILDSTQEDVDHTYEIDEIEEYEAQEGIGDDPVSASDAAVNGVDNANMPSVLMDRTVTMNYLVSYEGVKRGVKSISMQDNRMSISSMNLSYDESTGLLRGTTVVNMYCIPGQPGKEYVQPNFSSVLLGSDNIFGSIELYSLGLTLPGEDEAAEGEEGEETATE